MDRFTILDKLIDIKIKLGDLGFKAYIDTEYFEKHPELNLQKLTNNTTLYDRL